MLTLLPGSPLLKMKKDKCLSVMTVNKGARLENMANGLMRRYSLAGVAPPEGLYVDRDCCAGTTGKTKKLFSL